MAFIGIFELISLTQLCHKIPHDDDILLMLRLFLDTILKEHFVKSGEHGSPGTLRCPFLASTHLQLFPE